MATDWEGIYSSYGIEQSYPSDSYLDDLAFAAAWLYKATNAYEYLKAAHTYWGRSHAVNPYPDIVWSVHAIHAALAHHAISILRPDKTRTFLAAAKLPHRACI